MFITQFLVFCVIVRESCGYSNYHLAFETFISDSVFSRNKRSDDCTIGCLTEMVDDVKRLPDASEMQNQIQETVSALTSKFEKDQFIALCKDVMLPFMACLNSCGRTTVNSMMQESAKIGKLICIDRYQDMLDNYECLSKADNKVEEECVLNKCPSVEGSLKSMTNFGAKPDADKLTKAIGSYCKAVECSLPCSQKVITRECNEKIANITTYEFTQSAISSLKNVFEMTGGKLTFPAECRALPGGSASIFAKNGLLFVVISIVSLFFKRF